MSRKSADALRFAAPPVRAGSMNEAQSDSNAVKAARHLTARAARARLQARAVRSRTARIRKRLDPGRKAPTRLSDREREALALLSAGLPTKDIALQLGVTFNTAHYHVANLYRKLGVHSRVEAANVFFGRGERIQEQGGPAANR